MVDQLLCSGKSDVSTFYEPMQSRIRDIASRGDRQKWGASVRNRGSKLFSKLFAHDFNNSCPKTDNQDLTDCIRKRIIVYMYIAALFVEQDGCYFGLPGVDPWPESRDARLYPGPLPVVAHPDCKRWGRFWHGSTRKPHQYKMGDDGGCFASALSAVRAWGGVIEHPAHSNAWGFYNLQKPRIGKGWSRAGDGMGWTCYVEQGHYGHFSRKPTWLYAVGCELPELNWSRGEQRLHPVALEKHGYEKARRIGMCAMIGGKDKTRIRNATPVEFRDVLIGIAKSAIFKIGR